MPFRKILLVFLFAALPILVFSQTKTVKGFVFEEETGEPIAGATVSIQGSTRGVMTDLDGSFELPGVKATDVLRFELIGKEAQSITVGTTERARRSDRRGIRKAEKGKRHRIHFHCGRGNA